jgi:hypothetical protein
MIEFPSSMFLEGLERTGLDPILQSRVAMFKDVVFGQLS